MKRVAVMIALVAIVVGSAFATGVQENQAPAYGRGWNAPHGMMGYSDATAAPAETIEVSGTLAIEPGERPELISDDGTYELMYPYYLAGEIELTDGEPVAVEGVLVPGPRWESGEDVQHLAVLKATIGGTEYDLREAVGARTAFGPGHPMMHGRFQGPMHYDGFGYGPGGRAPRGRSGYAPGYGSGPAHGSGPGGRW